MKKTLLALALVGSIGSAAYAQNNVTIYGTLDIGAVKENGRDLRFGDNENNAIGFKGIEDLGGGYKAIFQLEKRFDLNDGTLGNTNTAGYRGSKAGNQKSYEGGANVGIAGPFGKAIIGRVNELTTLSIKKFDPFRQVGVGTQIYSLQRAPRIDNTILYESPNWNGFSFGASYSLGVNTNKKSIDTAHYGDLKKSDANNDGYAVNLSYDNGSFFATANWSRLPDSNDSSVWNIGLGYRISDTLRLTAAYEDTNSKGWKGNLSTGDQGPSTFKADDRLDGRQRNLLVGLAWDIGPGTLNASVQWDRLSSEYVSKFSNKGINGTDDAFKYSLGYTYRLSKRTSLYGIAAYTDYGTAEQGEALSGLHNDSVTAVQLGITHRF